SELERPGHLQTLDVPGIDLSQLTEALIARISAVNRPPGSALCGGDRGRAEKHEQRRDRCSPASSPHQSALPDRNPACYRWGIVTGALCRAHPVGPSLLEKLRTPRVVGRDITPAA